MIRGTGRTDFQNGDPQAQYQSLFGRLLKLPDETLVYPADDYKGDTVTAIGEERLYNPRLQVKSPQEYVDLMSSLHLTNPKMMDVALPANMHQGLSQEGIARRGWASAEEAKAVIGKPEVALIDLREKRERERDRHGKIPGGLDLPYHDLQENVSSNGVLPTLAATGKILLFYCAFGERSTMAVQAAQDAGLTSARHIEGGIDAWKKVDGVLDDGSGSPVHAPAVGT